MSDLSIIPPDVRVDVTPAPLCERCGSQMWLTQVRSDQNDDGHFETRTFECKVCGAIEQATIQEHVAEPLLG